MKIVRIICLILIILLVLIVAVFATWFLTSRGYKNNFENKKVVGNSIGNETKNDVVMSPKKGDVFGLGKSAIKIQWDTQKIDAYHIDFIPGEGNNDAPPYISIYGWNPQPPLDGEYIYSYMSIQSGFIPGNYKMRLRSKDGSKTFYSDEFIIASRFQCCRNPIKCFTYMDFLMTAHQVNNMRKTKLYMLQLTQERGMVHLLPQIKDLL